MPKFHATILTIFPEMFPGPLGCSLAGKALKSGAWSMDVINIREFGVTSHHNVDDTPYGGGTGLVMRPDVLSRALNYALNQYPDSTIYYLSPRGMPLIQSMVKEISTQNNIIILCGRFEGIDERIIDEYNPHQVSIGDYILSGGEIAAMALIDSAVRLVPGVVMNRQSLSNESFEDYEDSMQLLEHPLYTKPASWNDREVPRILLSGNHKKIAEWKRAQSIALTLSRNKLLNLNST